jgi:hypothetical protein
MVNAASAAITCAVLAAPVLPPADTTIGPLALPLAPDVIVSQDASVVAVQAQPASVLSCTVNAPPAAPTDPVVGLIENRHGAGAWLT